MKKARILAVTILFCLMATPAVYAYGLDDMHRVDIHGFISQGYLYTLNNNWMGDTEDGTWQFNELGLNFTSMLTQRLRIGMQFFARDLGKIGNDEILLDWAYADFSIRDWLGIRAGLIRNPYGIYGESRDIDFLHSSVFLPQTMYLEGVRDSFIQTKGGGIYGTIDTRAMGLFRYAAQGGITSIDLDSGTARLFEEKAVTGTSTLMSMFGNTLSDSSSVNSDVDMTYTVNLEWFAPLEGLRISGTYTRIDYTYDISYSLTGPGFPSSVRMIDNLVMEQDLWVASIEYTWSDLTIAAEFLRTYFETMVTSGAMPFSIKIGQHGHSWYTLAAYRPFDWFALGAYYGENYDSEDDMHGHLPAWDYSFQAWTKTTAFFIRFDINENWLIKAEYQYNDGVSLLSRKDNLDSSGKVDLDRIWHFLAFKITFNF